MRFVDDAKRAWRWFSVKAMALAAAVQTTWLSLPDDLRTELQHAAVGVTVALMVLGIVGRLVKQDDKK